MKKILLLSDTHGYFDEAMLRHAREADEVWHAGDIGAIEVADAFSGIKPFRAVHGNIDNATIRMSFPEQLFFECEGLPVLMIHIAGNPPAYTESIRKLLDHHKPAVMVCGHSHILKIVRNPKTGLLHINPGAAGRHGFHKVRTLVRFRLHQGKISEMDVIELGKKGNSTQPVG